MNFIYTMPTWGVIAAGLVIAAVAAVIAGSLWEGGQDFWMMFALVFLCVGCLSVGIPMAMRESANYAVWCNAQGGHVTSSTAVVSTGNGAGVATTTYCLSADGRILDVQ